MTIDDIFYILYLLMKITNKNASPILILELTSWIEIKLIQHCKIEYQRWLYFIKISFCFMSPITMKHFLIDGRITWLTKFQF